MDKSDIQNQLRAKIKSLTDSEWEYLVKESYVIGVLNGDYTVDEVAATVRKQRRIFGGGRHSGNGRNHHVEQDTVSEMLQPSQISVQRRQKRQERMMAISELLAYDAEQLPDVKAFRRGWLGDGLLTHEQVEGWIQGRKQADGEHTKWLSGEIPIPPGTEVIIPSKMLEKYPDSPPQWGIDPPLVINRAPGIQVQDLAYSVPGLPWMCRVLVRAGGVLDKLRHLSEKLADRYRWDEGQATVFVLTGSIPIVASIHVRITQTSPFPTLSRITLTIDPTLSPIEVAESYRKARRELFMDDTRQGSMSEKSMTLATFLAQRLEDESWKVRLKDWNQLYTSRGWGYDAAHLRNFCRDCIQAQRRLLVGKV